MKHILYLSKILDWYGDDFKGHFELPDLFPYLHGKDAATVGFYYRHATDSIRDEMTAKRLSVKDLDYDWSLNRRH